MLVRPLARDMFLSVCECKTSHSRAKVLAACANRRSPLPARAAKTRVVARAREKERGMRNAGGEKEEEADDDDVGGGEYIERASHSPLPPSVRAKGKGRGGKGKTRVLGENAERHKMEE